MPKGTWNTCCATRAKARWWACRPIWAHGPPTRRLDYVERHLELLARLNPTDANLVALQRRRPEVFARAAVWLEVARWHYERDHPDSAAS